MSKEIIKEQFLLPPKSVIKKEIYHFLLSLMEKIFLIPKNEKNSQKIEEHLNNYLEKINKEIIKTNEKFINTEYSINNFKNIINFVKGQNRTLAGDILEGVLILIFSYAFETDKTNTFGEFIYKNLDLGESDKKTYDYKLESSENFDLAKWFKKDLFMPQELKDLEALLKKDNKAVENSKKNALKNSPLYFLLLEIQKLKFLNVKEKNENKKIDQFIYRRNFKSKNILDKDFTNNFITNKIIRFFFISVFIYYQNKHSPLMKYIKEEKEHPIEYKYKEGEEEKTTTENKFFAGIPFEYNLSEANLENKFANSVLSPGRIEPRIEQIIMSENNLEERGFFELSKILIFNKYIKKCSFDTSTIKSHYLDYLNLGLGIYDNTTLEELNLYYNNLTKDSSEYLAKIIYHLKGLKTINLSCNDLKRGAVSFFVMLKELYRQGKTNLENLVLNKCGLDNSSLYELSELIKCPYCTLKRLYLGANYFPESIKFLKKLKKNKNLTEIYFNKCNFNDNNADDIMRIISNTHLQIIYLYNNRLTNFNNFFRILHRTAIIKTSYEEEYYPGHSSFLMNLDLSDNPFDSKNEDDILLLKKFLENTSLFSLDISHILMGSKPDKMISENNENTKDYKDRVTEIKKDLEKKKAEYEEKYDDENCLKIDKQEVIEFINDYKKKILEDKNFDEGILNFLNKYLGDRITSIINDVNSKFPLFLREKAKEIIGDIVSNKNDDNSRFVSIITNKIFKKSGDENENYKNKEINIEEYKKLENYLLYNMSLKRIENDYNAIKNFKDDYKLIII